MAEYTQVNEMPNIRLFFEKRGRAKYISHLDINRCMQRAFKRAEIPIWYTEGFNPHAYFTFALPIPLGFESVCESMDFRLTRDMDWDELRGRLNDTLPEGLRITHGTLQKHKPEAIAWADYDVRLWLDPHPDENLLAVWDAFGSQDQIQVEKRTKKGARPIDIKPHIQIQARELDGETLHIAMRAAAGPTLNISPLLYLDAACNQNHWVMKRYAVLRTAILEADGSPFA